MKQRFFYTDEDFEIRIGTRAANRLLLRVENGKVTYHAEEAKVGDRIIKHKEGR
jgi:hypothetical protein